MGCGNEYQGLCVVNAVTGQVEFQYGAWPLILGKIIPLGPKAARTLRNGVVLNARALSGYLALCGSQNKPQHSRGRNVRTCGPLG
jgi:hypothetical protein